MADLKDIIAKREELMKAWNTNYTDAMAEARRQVTTSQAPTAPTPAPIAPQPIQPAPVTPQVVPPQPIQPAPAPNQPTDWMGDFSQIKKRPLNVNDLPSQLTPEDQAKIDKMQAEWKFWQQSVETQPLQVWQTEFKPVDQTAKAKWIPWEAPVINRQQEIQNNLATGYQTNPWLFTDRAAYDKAYNYATKSPEEQATLDSFYNSKQPTISSMYSAIVNKQEVPDSTKMTPAYKIAQNRYSKASSFSSMTPSQVSDQMRSAKLVEWSQAFEDLKAINPKLVQDATNLRKVNGDTTNIWTTNPDGTKVNNLEKSIADDYTDNFGEFIKTMYKVYTPAEITAIIRTPDVVSAEDKAFAIEKNINEIDKQIANIDSEVDTEFKWSGATGSRLAMEKAARRDVLNKDRDSQVREYTTYANRASNLITQNTTSFQTQQQQQQAQNAAMLPFLTDKYKTEQEKIKAEAALKDPATAIKAVMDEYKKLGIPFTSTVQSRLAEFKASGKPLEQFLTEMWENIQQSPAYKKYQELQQGKMSDTAKMNAQQDFDIQKIKLQDSMKDRNIQRVGGTNDNPIYGYIDGNKVVTVSVPWSTTTGTTPTGNIVPVTAGNKTVRLDQVWATGFESAIGQLTAAWIPIVVWQGARDQTATIQSMANQYGIPFNASNPAETAQKLRSAWHQVADPGKSNHETGMAIDVYGSSKLDKVTPAQEKILNANGWYSANISGDAGHFEYRGNWSWSTSSVDKEATLERIRRGQVTDSDLGKIQQKAISGWWWADFTEALKKWMKSSMTDSQIKWLATVDDKIQKDTTLDNVNLVSQQKETIKWLLNTDINANGFNDIALINAFQKIVDPWVSVKEGDVSLLQSSIALKDKLNPSNLISKVNAGTKLTPETRKQMLDSTVAIYNAQADFGNDLLQKRYYKLADNYGINLADYGYGYDKIDKAWKTSSSKLSSVMSILEKIIANAPK